MNLFDQWNLLLLRHYFGRGSEGQRVWFDASPDELSIIGLTIGGDESLIQGVREGPSWPSIWAHNLYLGRGGPCDLEGRAVGLCKQRQRDRARRPSSYIDPGLHDPAYVGCDAPTYLPILALLTRTAALTSGGDDGYYSRLNDTLGCAIANPVQSLRTINRLWDDLTQWTADCKGWFGVFRAEQLGGYSLIGVPRSQVILSASDAQRAPVLFHELGWKPSSGIPSNGVNQMRQLVLSGGCGYLSSPCRQAIADYKYEVPVAERFSYLLQEWDGELPEREHRPDATTQGATRRMAMRAPTMLIADLAAEVPDWQVGLATESRGDFTPTSVSLYGASLQVCGIQPSRRAAMMPPALSARLLNEALEGSVAFNLSGTDWGSGDELEQLPGSVGKRLIRYFVATGRVEGTDNQILFVEQEGPSIDHPTLLLVSPGASSVTRLVLSTSRITCIPLPTAGLPAGWELLRVDPEWARSLAAAVGQLPGERPGEWEPRRLRLVGGQRVRRGGIEFFLRYDLPWVEVDAPSDSVLEVEGFALREVTVFSGSETLHTVLGAVHFGVRRFELRPSDGRTSLGVVRLKCPTQAWNDESRRLRIATDHLEGAGSSGLCAIDPAGNPVVPSTSVIQGMACHSDDHAINALLNVPAVGRKAEERDLDDVATSALAQVLDQVSLRGAVPAHDLRQFIAKRLSTDGGSGHEVPNLIRTAWTGGLVEVESDEKGRHVRIHAVPPMLYVTNIRTHAGECVAGFAGSWRSARWSELAAEISGIARLVVLGESMNPGCLRIVAPSADDLSVTAEKLGVAFVNGPAFAISRWMADIDSIDRSWQEWLFERVLPDDSSWSTEYFNPALGVYKLGPCSTAFGSALLRASDLDSRHSVVHAIRFHRDGGSREAFVRDALWGRWHALRSAASHYASMYGRRDLSPWPIPFQRDTNSIWLPALLDLPTLAARAAVASGGFGREVHDVRGIERPDGRVEMRSSEGVSTLLEVSSVYRPFLPIDGSCRRWIEYRWVVPEVAETIARKLGAQLDPYPRTGRV